MKFLNDDKRQEQEVSEQPSSEIISEMTPRDSNKPVEKLSLATYLKAGYSLIYSEGSRPDLRPYLSASEGSTVPQ